MAPSWYVTMLDLGLRELLDDPTTPPEVACRLRDRLAAIRAASSLATVCSTFGEQPVSRT